jgi:Uma2 family endonuclease
MDLLTPESLPRAESPDYRLLHNGDRLRSDEFLRRYDRMPDLKEAELVEGTVFMGSPASYINHSRPDSLLQTWIGVYISQHPELEGGPNATVVLDTSTVVQPDLVLFRRQGSVKQYEQKLLTGVPEMVVEIAASSVSLDAGAKLVVYEKHRMQEYIVWRVLDGELDIWRYSPETKSFEASYPDEDGLWSSQTFPGLVLDVPAALRYDRAAVLKPLLAVDRD